MIFTLVGRDTQTKRSGHSGPRIPASGYRGRKIIDVALQTPHLEFAFDFILMISK